jgi:catechol-2,3-dioxygenase
MRLLEIHLAAVDLTAAYSFYAGDLGLPVIRQTPAALTLQAGASRLIFRKADANGAAPSYHFAFNIHPARFERARAMMAAITPLVHDHDGRDVFDFRSWDATACYFIDPLGNVGELIARRDLRSERALTEPGILSIGEIGLVTGDVPAMTRRLSRELNIDVYRDSAGAEFAALGDENGLLIITPPGRVWYPDTGKRAVTASLDILLEAGDGHKWRLEVPAFSVRPQS